MKQVFARYIRFGNGPVKVGPYTLAQICAFGGDDSHKVCLVDRRLAREPWNLPDGNETQWAYFRDDHDSRPLAPIVKFCQ